MKTFAAAVLLAFLSLNPAHAQELFKTLGEFIDKGGIKMSKDELNVVVPGTKHNSRTNAFGLRNWIHDPEGRLTAHGSVKAQGGRAMGRELDITANGTWSVIDPGLYCFTIDWNPRNPESTEKRCMTVYKLGDSYYGVASDVDKTSTQMLAFTLQK